MSRKDIVNQISQAIRRVDPTATAILYGSEARGDARPDSDIDVLILLDGERRDLKHGVTGCQARCDHIPFLSLMRQSYSFPLTFFLFFSK